MVLKSLKKKVSITLDEDVLNKIKALAEESDRSLSQYVNILLKEHIRNSKDK